MLNLKNAVESQKSMQATNAPSKFKKMHIIILHVLSALNLVV